MNKTENYQLSQWEKTDRIMMDDFNSDNSKIDAALAALAGTSADHTAAIAKLGNCQLYTTSYTGDGTYGESDRISLTFPQAPQVVAVVGDYGASAVCVMIRGQGTSMVLKSGESPMSITVTWSGKTVRWYGTGASAQMNASGITYRVAAWAALE